MGSITRFITHRRKLKVNQAKSAVARPGQRKFLGFSFTSEREPWRRIAPRLALVARSEFENKPGEPVASACGRWSKTSRPICEAGLDTSAIVKRRRGCKPLKRGYAADFARWCGSNGSADGHGFANFANGASARIARRKPPGVRTVPGDARTRLPLTLRCPTPTLLNSDSHLWSCGISIIRRTAVCGPACTVVSQGRRGDPSPYVDS
jgi:hypothetical protein